MQTIPRNHTRKIAALAAKLTECKVYALDSNFAGLDCDPAFAWKRLNEGYGAKLYDRGNGQYVIQLHSNCWYELREPAQVEPAAAEIPADMTPHAAPTLEIFGALVILTKAGMSRGRAFEALMALAEQGPTEEGQGLAYTVHQHGRNLDPWVQYWEMLYVGREHKAPVWRARFIR
jgi:hypothetical protein